MNEDLESRLAAYELSLRESQAQIGALTRRVFQLEQGGSFTQEALPPALDQQPAPVVPPSAAIQPAVEQDWEAQLGTNWLNRAGVLLLVIGITLFLGFAMAAFGPAGKIAIGIVTGAALLAAGYWYEHQGNFRPFSLGMLAGGFAVLYATAYASHAVEASRIFTNLYVGIALQTALALVAVWQAVQLASERAAILAYLAAYLGLASSTSLPFVYAGAYPLTLSALWLADRLGWRTLPWTILAYTWFCEIQTGSRDWDFKFWGHPVAWVNLGLFAAFEIRERTREWSWRNPAWIVANVAWFLTATFLNTRFEQTTHVASILALLAAVSLIASLVRARLSVRHEAIGEAITLLAAAAWAIARYGESDPLLMLMLMLAIAMFGLFRNRFEPTTALTLSAEGLLAMVALVLLFLFPESRLTISAPLRIHLALPQVLALIVCLFAAGRWFTSTSWPSGAALVGVAVLTLVTIPKTMGTIVLAFEAILCLAVGFYLARRPIRIGGLALFIFSILKVFLYDLGELDTLPRIFSFIVLGLFLIAASWAYTKYRQQLQKYL